MHPSVCKIASAGWGWTPRLLLRDGARDGLGGDHDAVDALVHLLPVADLIQLPLLDELDDLTEAREDDEWREEHGQPDDADDDRYDD